MSTNPIWTTHCDSAPDDPTYPQSERCPGWAEQEDTKKQARDTATRHGWALGIGDLPDLCRHCTPRSWCPRCGARDSEHCSTASGRDHRDRTLLMIAAEAMKGAGQPDASMPCAKVIDSWAIYSPEQVDRYDLHCTKVGPHDEHEDADSGATWSAKGADQ